MFIQSSLRELSDLLLAYAPQPSFDDVAWYGLAYLRVYEMDKTASNFFRVAKDIYRWIWVQGWDESGKYQHTLYKIYFLSITVDDVFSIISYDSFVFQTSSEKLISVLIMAELFLFHSL